MGLLARADAVRLVALNGAWLRYGVVEVKFGTNAPLELATTFNEGYVKVFIAPRVE